jgi:urea carboxylase
LFKRVLIANRGAIAVRIMRTLRKLGVEPVAIYSEADAGSLHVQAAAEAICVGPAAAAESYLNTARIIAAAHESQAEAVHPGYGFLSENPQFAQECEEAGLIFLGPTPSQIRAFGLKNTAREIALAAGSPVLPGTDLLLNEDEALGRARQIGYPVMLKSAGGGGGIGMRRCGSDAELREGFESVLRLSETHFKGSGIFLEKFIPKARHIEVQTFGDGQGGVVSLGERDCSAQRRNQKVVEETPAPHLCADVRRKLHQTAVELMQSVSYRSAGTVEFLYDTDTEKFYFLEVNSRLQVEHGVTEEVWGVDIVEWMVRLGASELPALDKNTLTPKGWSIQTRLYAENPLENFQPSSGRITELVPPANARFDTWIETGSEVTPFYDPLLAKIIAKGEDRPAAVQALHQALAETRVAGIETNLEFLRAVISHPEFASGTVTTRFLNNFSYAPAKVKVQAPGVLSIVQQYPGRLGFWDVGVPPSGPMDPLSHRLANRLLNNAEDAPVLECTLSGPTLQFLTATRIALGGASMQAKLDGKPVSLWTSVPVPAGATLTLGSINGAGARTYIAVEGGFAVPSYLGSATTFTLGNFGGHAGRALRAGDYLSINTPAPSGIGEFQLKSTPELSRSWTIGVLYGPHGAPDFLTEDDVATFFSSSWRVHHNSSRTGVRRIFTTTPMPSEPSTSRATCQSSWDPMAPVWEASSVQRLS